MIETVQVYGKCGATQFYGPFYCGMSRVMNMPQFQIQLRSPTSTTLHLEVAMKFSGEQGLIIEFSNNVSDLYSGHTKGFDVSYISRYKEEEER